MARYFPLFTIVDLESDQVNKNVPLTDGFESHEEAKDQGIIHACLHKYRKNGIQHDGQVTDDRKQHISYDFKVAPISEDED